MTSAALARQFGGGMSVLSFDDDDLRAKLVAAVDGLWDAAPALHAPLRAAAAVQIARSDAAYDRFCGMVAARQGGGVA